ncbi:TetR/AcrR family transcriptional regulator [Desulfosporosinus metallidurans]|uniref:Transcription regulator of multidrug efflux pump operon, TetR (AcrR) family n=1 Tax=Desulfosporosinus metallidurans TaxID=1888891 RepID=A0A1Q8QLN9_9FIRM|nr:TetR/AcrR family transcriptional regulator [Desulfosporosinus metallidurans]OLN28250.1 Transcription regulator of multidrug efflux pump operon, TetR (AcrR) family [Desulfosporosinus metallidurans]
MRKKDDEKQRCIKIAVVQLILEEGFQGTSISKIAKAAGVSPATVYIYYENKETMLREIYREYSEDAIRYLLQCLSPNMVGEEIIAELIRRYYFFIIENKEVFHFIEQFSTCPVLQSSCGSMKGPADLNQLLTDLKKQKILNNFNNDNLYAILFAPVKMIAVKSCESENIAMERLDELIYIIQKALLKDFKI